jgi:hypothetical protein
MRRSLAIAALLVATPVAVMAHHGWGSFDASKRITVEGPIQMSEYANPHATIKVKATDQVWTVELAPVSRMEARGATKDMIAVGKSIKAEGNPSKSHKDLMRAERITVDGKTFEMR